MPRILTVQQIQDLDKAAIERYGISSLVLMENAGRAVAQEVKKSLCRHRHSIVCVVCGLGNNAGDGLVAARHLINAGIDTKIFCVGKINRLKEDAAINGAILKKARYPIREIAKPHAPFVRDITHADCVVDAIFGIGLNREIVEPFRGVIETINRQAKYIIAVDIPSGLDGTNGRIYGVCIKADKTVTFSFPKKGFFKNHGPRQTGKVIVVDIGIPMSIS